MAYSLDSEAIRPAINCSPLILLTGTGLLDLLQLANPQVVVPAAVATEIRRRGALNVTVQALVQIKL